MHRLMVALVAMSLSAAPAAAKPPLREVARIDDALLDLGIANLVRENCPTISARIVAAVFYVRRLQSEARELGYTDAEIEAYTKSDAEKARMRKRGDAIFVSRGVDTSDPQSYCEFGLAEIEKSSRIGSLLRAE